MGSTSFRTGCMACRRMLSIHEDSDFGEAASIFPNLRDSQLDGGPARTHLKITASPEGFRTGKRTRRGLPKHLGKPSCHSGPYRVTDQNWSSRPQKASMLTLEDYILSRLRQA